MKVNINAFITKILKFTVVLYSFLFAVQSVSAGHIYCHENNLNRTTSELELCILVTHYRNFSKSKGHNSAENYSTRPKFKLNLCILLTHIMNFNSKCQFVMEIMSTNWKLMEFFLSPRGITLTKIIRPDQNSNSTCIFSWHIIYTEFKFKMSICNGDSTCVFGQTHVLNFIWISMYDLDNEQNWEGRNNRRTECRKGVTLYAQAIFMAGAYIRNSTWYSRSQIYLPEVSIENVRFVERQIDE